MRKDFNTIESKITDLLEKYPRLRSSNVNEIIIGYIMEYCQLSKEELKVVSKTLKEVPSLSSIIRLIYLVREKNSSLDDRNSSETKMKSSDFRKYLKYIK